MSDTATHTLTPMELLIGRAIATSGRVNAKMDERLSAFVTAERTSAQEALRVAKAERRSLASQARDTASKRLARARANREYALLMRAEWEDARNALLAAQSTAASALVTHVRGCAHARAMGVTYELTPAGKVSRTIAPNYLAFEGDWEAFAASHFSLSGTASHVSWPSLAPQHAPHGVHPSSPTTSPRTGVSSAPP